MYNRSKTIAVVSGKGGVGKSVFIINLALLYASIGKRVIVFDTNLGISNIDVLFGIAPKYNIKQVLSERKKLTDIIAKGPLGIDIVPASSGIRALTRLTEEQKEKILSAFEQLEIDYDVILIDTAPGISDNVFFFTNIAQEKLIMVTPEPTSLADAYALIKILSRDFEQQDFRIIINLARSEKEAFDAFRKLQIVSDKFLKVDLKYVGYLPKDDRIIDSVMAQKGFIAMFPNSHFSRKLAVIGKKLLNSPFHGNN